MKNIFVLLLIISSLASFAQNSLSGRIRHADKDEAVVGATIFIAELKTGTTADAEGNYKINKIPTGLYTVRVGFVGHKTIEEKITISGDVVRDFKMVNSDNSLEEVVVTGTMKEVSKLESPVPIEIYTPRFFQKNPTPNLFDALQNINGVRPQLNCNVCNTGDIHINGLEGPYTMVLIDGMPIVSSLATVYGLSGIPNSLVERIEVVKGPAATLYGSEAVGGLINVITKNPTKAPVVSADVMATSWQEFNTDIGVKYRIGEVANALVGVNYFNYSNPIDKNNDGFTDMTLQNRISIFNKIDFKRTKNRTASIAGRYFYENRWGGQMNWTPAFRGGDEVYGESIYTRRVELIGNYQLPVKERIMFQYSYNYHNQNSVYGNVPYLATQQIGFAQLLWDKTVGKHSMLFGAPFRYTFYDDNTPATMANDGRTNKPDNIYLPGLFVQDEISLTPTQKLLLGLRYDYNSRHGNILTPRASYKVSFNESRDVLRVNFGTGYRIVNLFTEDHAALTGARQVVIKEELKPEQSWNINLNYIKKIVLQSGFIGIDASAFYTRFSNRILPDYDTDPNKIIYDNLQGFSVSKGISMNLDFTFASPLKILAGGTLMNVDFTENGVTTRQPLTERFTGTWGVSYEFQKAKVSLDYTGNLYGPMILPLAGELDPRPDMSPVWSLQNIQFTKKFDSGLEIYGGVKNILDFVPYRNIPFLIARANDPFDKNVQFGADGAVLATPTNPYALTFDPTYMYAPMQGRRTFLGVRYLLK
ncbi:MAG: TonB-dependent receptor [Spirosomaceae bacterium]|nr:TonB-dependent receptor [Spirosomataceae bacterium]